MGGGPLRARSEFAESGDEALRPPPEEIPIPEDPNDDDLQKGTRVAPPCDSDEEQAWSEFLRKLEAEHDTERVAPDEEVTGPVFAQTYSLGGQKREKLLVDRQRP